jgi:hypothetical protein
MTLCEFQKRGFSFVSEKRGPVDERGIDGVMLLKKKHAARGGSNGAKFYAAAHYRVGNQWGEPCPIPQGLVK